MDIKAERYDYKDFTEEKYRNIIKLAHERGNFCSYDDIWGGGKERYYMET